jgi:hypothetical protein
MKNLVRPANLLLKLRVTFCLLCAFFILTFAGRKQGKHTSNPRLRQIDDMLDPSCIQARRECA